jgi:hypothetical protein
MTKTQQKKLLTLVKRILTARRNKSIKQEQAAYDKLHNVCIELNLDLSEVLNQGTDWLKRNSIAASMNGIV